MNAQMKSSRSYKPPTPCICGKVCPCHNPKPYDSNADWFAIGAFLLVFVILGTFFATMNYFQSKHPPQAQHIEVNGQDCIIEYHNDGSTSTGASWGHDVAVCPK
jgi:hypothetical protein